MKCEYRTNGLVVRQKELKTITTWRYFGGSEQFFGEFSESNKHTRTQTQYDALKLKPALLLQKSYAMD